MKSETELDELVQALRADLPGRERTSRVRARLIAAGVAVGTTVSAGSAVAGAAAGSALAAEAAASTGLASGVVASFLSLSWGAKIGVAALVCVSTGAGPVWLWHSSEKAPAPTADAASATRKVVSAPRRATHDAELASTSEPAARSAPQREALAPLSNPQPATVPSGKPIHPALTPPSRARTSVARSEQVTNSELPSTGSFELPPESSPERSTLPARPALQEDLPPATLKVETALMDRAFAALRDGDLIRMERLLAEHQRGFPNGHLRLERERAFVKLEEAKKTRRTP